MEATVTWEQSRRHRSRLRVLESALALFADGGYEAATFQSIAARAGVSTGLACRYFPTKEHLALAAYDGLARALCAWVPEMPAGSVATRFRAAMTAKLALLAPQRRAMVALTAAALDPDGRAAVLGDDAEVVRSRVSGVFAAVVRGADDAPQGPGADRLARGLYGAHLALVLLWLQDRSPDARATLDALDLLCGLLAVAAPSLAADDAPPLVARVDGIFRDLLRSTATDDASGVARAVLTRIFRRRRVLPDVAREPTEAAYAMHLPRVEGFVRAGEPIQLVLPAFPAKAPNPEKVLGRRPDMAERLALESLTSLLDELSEAHAPGATLVIASDGHVFADAVGVSDRDVSRYREDLEAMIAELGTDRVRVFGLDDAFGERSPAAARKALLARYGRSVDEVAARAARSRSHGAQLDGIHRFLFEDACARERGRSRTQLRRETRPLAVEVVRRSDAWGSLVTAAFPRAVRLSIHPQPDVSDKVGVHLLATDDAWLTPWHGAALLDGGRFRLVKRRDAPDAAVVDEDGRPSYLEVAR